MATTDNSEASRFLAALTCDTRHTFQTFDDAKQSRQGLTRIVHGQFQTKADTLANANAKGAGVFVMVNKGDGKGRKNENVQSVRAVFVDLDGAPLAPVLNAAIPPPIIVQTSPDKYHAYWPVQGLPLEQFKCVQQALAAKFNGDAKVCDLARVMRLPGFYHRKATPFLSRLVKCETVQPYSWQEFANVMGLPVVAEYTKRELPAQIPQGTRNAELFGLACGLRQKGLSQADALSRLAKVNMERCQPPIAQHELADIVASAWKQAIRRHTSIPNAILHGADFAALPPEGKLALIKAYSNYNGSNNGSITLTDDELHGWGLTKRIGRRGRNAAKASGLLIQTKKASSTKPKPAFYQLQHVHKSGG